MMITLEKAIQKSMTRPRLSVHQKSFLWALCQELIRSTTHLFVARRGAGLPFSQTTPTTPRSASGSVVMWVAIHRVRSLYSCAHKTTKLVFGEWRCLSQTTH